MDNHGFKPLLILWVWIILQRAFVSHCVMQSVKKKAQDFLIFLASDNTPLFHAFRWYSILHTHLSETSSGHLKLTQRLQSLGFQTSASQGILVYRHRGTLLHNHCRTSSAAQNLFERILIAYSRITNTCIVILQVSELKNLIVRFKASNITWWNVPKMIIELSMQVI